MLHVGLDLSRRRVDVCVVDEGGEQVEVTTAFPDVEGLRDLAWRVGRHGEPVAAAIESMNGARFVHDQLEDAGWVVTVADALKVRGIAPLACKTDRIDAYVLATLSRLDLVPAVWLPDPTVRQERERARYRLHLVRHRTRLKNRIHATLITFGKPVTVSDLFGVAGRRGLDCLDVPDPWASNVATSLGLIDTLEREILLQEQALRRLGATHRYVPLLKTIPGIADILGYTIAAEIGDIGRFPSAKKLVGYTGLCPRVHQSGGNDYRGPLAKNGPRYLRWALVEASVHAARHPAYRDRYQQIKTRLGNQRGAKVARVDIARRLATAIWWMLTTNEPFAPASPPPPLAA